MCLAIPGKVVKIEGDPPEQARVEISGVRRQVFIGLLTDVQVGDWVLVHVGMALSKLDEADAQQTLRYLEEMGQAYRDELALMGESCEVD